MTVEAAVVLPVFLFAVANLLSLFLVFWTYSSKEAQLHQTARQLALYAYGQEDGEPDVRLMRLTPVSAPFGTAAFRSSYVVNGCVMHKWIGYSGDGTGEDWERQEEELVYITKSGEAYHRERSCLFESVHPPCGPGGNNSRLYTMQRMCWQGTVRKSADLCDGRRKQIS